MTHGRWLELRVQRAPSTAGGEDDEAVGGGGGRRVGVFVEQRDAGRGREFGGQVAQRRRLSGSHVAEKVDQPGLVSSGNPPDLMVQG